MTQLELIKKYPDVNPTILSQYKEAEKFIIVNDGDKDLFAVNIFLPSPPELHKIAGFGKSAKDQKFTPPKLPEKLKTLTKNSETIDDVYNALRANQFFYRKELQFIKNQWMFMLNGYWFFNNGVPTYIDGWHYFYIAWWKIDVGLPKYRARDRKFFLFARHCYTCTTAIYKYRIFYEGQYKYYAYQDDALRFCKELVIPKDNIERGVFEVDMGRRTLFGFIYPKYRREGATFKASVINYCIAITHKMAHCGIQSMTDKDAKKVFRKAIISPWKKLPFFFRPLYEGNTDPKEELSFNPPSEKLSNKGSKVNIKIGLESSIDFAIADGSGYDGQKLFFHHHDEVGKFRAPLNVSDINSVIKECLSTEMGLNIIGLGIKTTTVDDMDDGKGGREFKELCKMSMYDERNANGHTSSGFVLLYIKSEEGVVIDEYGNSIIETPPKKLVGEEGQVITRGGREVIHSNRNMLLSQGNFEELARDTRKFPNTFAEVFSVAGGTSRLPVGLIQQRLSQISLNNPTKLRGNFYWENGFGSTVQFSPDDLGKCYLSIRLKPGEANRKFYDSSIGSWVPGNRTKFTLGIDPFKFDVTKGSRRSNGGGYVKYNWDPLVDPSSDWREWQNSCRGVCTYSNRTFDKEEFYDDMLKIALYFGAGVYPEINVYDIVTWFNRKGYGEYLIYKVDPKTMKESVSPGDSALLKHKEKMFNDISTQLIRHGMREIHDEWLMECMLINGPKDMTNYDLFAAAGWAEIGSQEYYDEIETVSTGGNDLKDYFPKFRI